MAQGMNKLNAYNTYWYQQKDKEERLKKRFINFVLDSNFRLLLSACIKLSDHNKEEISKDEQKNTIRDFKNGMLKYITKLRQIHLNKQVKERYDNLKKWNAVNILKERALKKIIYSNLNKRLLLQQFGMNKLRCGEGSDAIARTVKRNEKLQQMRVMCDYKLKLFSQKKLDSMRLKNKVHLAYQKCIK